MAGVPEIRLNKETIAFAMACFTLAGALFGVYNWLLSGRAENSPIVRELLMKDQTQDQRLDRTDEDRANNTKALRDQTAETQRLRDAVIRLTTVMERGQETKRADYITNDPFGSIK